MSTAVDIDIDTIWNDSSEDYCHLFFEGDHELLTLCGIHYVEVNLCTDHGHYSGESVCSNCGRKTCPPCKSRAERITHGAG